MTKLQILRVEAEGPHLRVIFDRDDCGNWSSTPEGIRAARVLKSYGSHRVNMGVRSLVVFDAANERAINTVRACQAALDEGARKSIGFQFSSVVKSSAGMTLTRLDDVRAQMEAGNKVWATVKVEATLPLLRQDFEALARAGYGMESIVVSDIMVVVFRLSVARGADPWKMLAHLRSNIERIIK